MKRRTSWLAVGIVLVTCGAVSAATLTVDLNGGGNYTDIQSAIDTAADGDTVLVRPGEYVIAEPINFNRLHDPENQASPHSASVSCNIGTSICYQPDPSRVESTPKTGSRLAPVGTRTRGHGWRQSWSATFACSWSGWSRDRS